MVAAAPLFTANTGLFKSAISDSTTEKAPAGLLDVTLTFPGTYITPGANFIVTNTVFVLEPKAVIPTSLKASLPAPIPTAASADSING